MYVEDLKRGTNKDIGPKDIFEMGSTCFSRLAPTVFENVVEFHLESVDQGIGLVGHAHYCH